MATHTQWFNLQHSFNPFQAIIDENSRTLNRNNENSLSYFQKYPPLPQEEQSHNIFNFHVYMSAMMENQDNILKNEQIQRIQQYNSQTSQENIGNLEQSDPQSRHFSQESIQSFDDLENKKGLKNLAKLLIMTLKRKKISSSKYLTEQIQDIIMKRKNLSKQEKVKESKNIRRRTYDALNVMIAANVLNQDLDFIKRVNALSFTKKCSEVIGSRAQVQNKIQQLTEKINKKRDFLRELQHKKNNIAWWIRKNKQQSEKKNKGVQEEELWGCCQNIRRNQQEIKENRIEFPVVFIEASQKGLPKNSKLYSLSQSSFEYKNNKIKIFSEIDAFKILKPPSQHSKIKVEAQQSEEQQFTFKNVSKNKF